MKNYCNLCVASTALFIYSFCPLLIFLLLWKISKLSHRGTSGLYTASQIIGFVSRLHILCVHKYLFPHEKIGAMEREGERKETFDAHFFPFFQFSLMHIASMQWRRVLVSACDCNEHPCQKAYRSTNYHRMTATAARAVCSAFVGIY